MSNSKEVLKPGFYLVNEQREIVSHRFDDCGEAFDIAKSYKTPVAILEVIEEDFQWTSVFD